MLQLGQGGNQFGFTFLEALSSLSTPSTPPHDFFKEPLQAGDPAVARAVLIDTEPKVVAAVKRRTNDTGSWRYGPQSSFTQDSGSGNNWARGFYKHGPRCQEAVMDLVRREVEMCDIFGGFVSMQSVAGGTGAGLGAYLLEVLRDEYPSCCTLSHCIWPLEGEVSVQCYNALLSIAHLQDSADGLILVRNEALMSTCRKVLGIQRPSFDDMNEVGARALASVLLPAYHHAWSRSRDPKQGLGKAICKTKSIDDLCRPAAAVRFRPLSDLVSALCAHPKYRMLALRATPQIPVSLMNLTTYSWKSHLKQLKRMVYTEPSRHMGAEPSAYDNMSKPNHVVHCTIDHCLANLLVLRGRDSTEADVTLFDDKALYPIWSVDPLTVATHSAHLGKYDMFAGLLSNCHSAIAPASHALSRAYAMYSSKAYLYQYFDHGLDRNVFDASFAKVQDILAHYLSL